jgi:hypothetical protein
MDNFNKVASKISSKLLGGRTPRMANDKSPQERDSEWQRVNSGIADVLKDAHVLYSKMARLQGDFIGKEREKLEEISENILSIGNELSEFIKSFHDGSFEMQSDSYFGSPNGAPQGTPPPQIPQEFESRSEMDLDSEIDEDEEDDMGEFDQEDVSLDDEKDSGGEKDNTEKDDEDDEDEKDDEDDNDDD